MKFYIKTFGCRVNQVESEALLEEFLRLGHTLTKDLKEANLCLINTCSVTRNADKDALKEAHSISVKNPKTKLIITGCFARHGKEEILRKVPSALVINKEDLPKFIFNQDIDWTVKEHEGKTRAFVKIQDGCDCFCTYCIVPFTRPIKTSKPKRVVLEEIKNLIEANYKEIVLTGINIGNYLCAETSTNLAGLLKEIFELKGNFRIRFSSIELPTVTDELLMVMKSGGKKFCNYLHLPLQSGSESVLKKMGRRYTAQNYENRVKEIRKLFKDIFIYTDIIAAFPTETLQDFEETQTFIKKINFAGLHVFSYSPRPMTKAANWPQIDGREIKRRADTLREIDSYLRQKHATNLIGKVQSVLVEEIAKEGNAVFATSSNFQKVTLKGKYPQNTLLEVKITGQQKGICTAEVIKD